MLLKKLRRGNWLQSKWLKYCIREFNRYWKEFFWFLEILRSWQIYCQSENFQPFISIQLLKMTFYVLAINSSKVNGPISGKRLCEWCECHCNLQRNIVRQHNSLWDTLSHHNPLWFSDSLQDVLHLYLFQCDPESGLTFAQTCSIGNVNLWYWEPAIHNIVMPLQNSAIQNLTWNTVRHCETPWDTSKTPLRNCWDTAIHCQPLQSMVNVCLVQVIFPQIGINSNAY
jgi:hypothetical protein